MRTDVAQQGEFFAIHLAIMQPGTMAPVDLHFKDKATGRFVLYNSAQTPFDHETRERLLDHSVDVLYLHKEDQEAYDDYVEQHISAIIRDDLLPPEEAGELVYRSSSHVMQDVFEDPRSGKNLRRTQNMVEAMVLSIIKDPDALWHMTAMASHDYYTYTHCVNVSLFLVATSERLLGINDQKTLEQIGLGGMLHDIGKSQVPAEILAKPGKLTDEESEKIKEHPLLGLQITAAHMKLRPTSSRIVRSHHEHFNGAGYPDRLTGDAIPQVARLANIVDVYDALTTNRTYAAASKPYEALELMLTRMKEEFDFEMLSAFVRFLGPRDARSEFIP